MKALSTIVTLLICLTACANNPGQVQEPKSLSDYQAELRDIDSSDGIDVNEAELIFQSFVLACGKSTLFNTYYPIKYKNVWLSQLYFGDIVSLPTITPIVLEEETGFVIYNDISIGHFSGIFEECEKNSPLLYR